MITANERGEIIERAELAIELAQKAATGAFMGRMCEGSEVTACRLYAAALTPAIFAEIVRLEGIPL